MIYIEPDVVKVENLSIVYRENKGYVLRDRSRPRCKIPIYIFQTIQDIESFLLNLKHSDDIKINIPFIADFKSEKSLFIQQLENQLLKFGDK